MKLSILMPVYNERTMVERCIAGVLAAPAAGEHGARAGRSSTIVPPTAPSDILERLAAAEPAHPPLPARSQSRQRRRRAHRHPAGAPAISPSSRMPTWNTIRRSIPVLLRPLLDGRADAVFGSRYLAGEQTRVLPFWHSMINKGLTLISNMFCNLNLTDMETCYKVFRTDLLKSIPIRSDRFGFEPEITMKCAKRKLRIYEVPISYHGRTYEEGKKIGWRDGLKALGVILKFWVIDDLYAVPYGRGVLNNLTGTPQYLSWLARTLRPYLGDTVLEIGAGIGNLCRTPDGAASALRCRRNRRSASARAPQPVSAHAERAGAPHRSGASPPISRGWNPPSTPCSRSTFSSTWTIPRPLSDRSSAR